MDTVTGKRQAGVVPDPSWLPDLIEIGGFLYEAGCRDFAAWTQALKDLAGDSVEPLLQETWECIPRSAAEKFGTLANRLTDLERLRLWQAFQHLNFRNFGQSPAALIETLGAELASAFPASPQTALGAGAGLPQTGIHHHICIACGMPFTHGDWDCEPPDDQYCNLCAEAVAGPRPVWIQRRSEGAEADGKVDPPNDAPVGSSENGRKPAKGHRHSIDTRPSGEHGPKANVASHVAGKAGTAPAPAHEADRSERGTASSPPAEAQVVSRTEPESHVVITDRAQERSAEADILQRLVSPAERGFGKVAGMHELKKLLYEEVVSALRDPEDLKAYGLGIPNGILLFGPPGCGKTYISRQLAEEMNYFFKEIYPSEIGSTFIHETTLKIREVFDFAFQNAPSIVFIDEFESMVPARKNLGAHQQHTAEEVSEFLKQLESCADRKILLIAATNEPWKIDPAVQRTGRLDKKIYVGPPDRNARAEMLRFHLYGRRMDEINVAALGESLAGYSASDIKLLVDEAARLARRSRVPITEAHLRMAAKERVFPSVTPEDEQKYLAFGQRGVKAVVPTYVVNNSTWPDRRPADLVRKWGRGRPAAPDFSRNKP